jgi:Cu/Ag efflux protein CusF
MKTKLTRSVVTLGTVFVLGWGSTALADSSSSAARMKTSSGVLVSVDQKDKTAQLKTFWGTRKFNVANDCKVSLQDKTDASLTELRPGQKVEISYESAQGVLVAHQIAQENVVFTGQVKSIDPAKRKLTVRSHMLDKTFWIADNCRVVLRDEKSGVLSDVQPGHRATVTYETPDGSEIAHEIIQLSATFTGSLTAIDLNDRTLKAKTLLGAKKFNLADDCRILVGDKPDAKLSDLKLGDKLVISYDDQNGVNIVNRIVAPAPSSDTAGRTSADRASDSSVPATPVY